MGARLDVVIVNKLRRTTSLQILGGSATRRDDARSSHPSRDDRAVI